MIDETGVSTGAAALLQDDGAPECAVDAGGLRLYTKRRHGPSQPPLVLLHGIGGSLESWGPVLAALPDRDIVMVDCPGVGRSQPPSRPLRMGAIADHLVTAVAELGIGSEAGDDRFDLLGFSLGGLMAQEIAHRHPTRVRRLILVATIMGVWAQPPGPLQVAALLSTRRHHDPAAAARDLPRLAGGRTARDAVALAGIVTSREAHPPTARGYRYQQLAVLGWTSYRWLPRLAQPTLLLAGGDDPIVKPLNMGWMASRIPNAELHVLDGAGHMLLFDEPTRAAGLIEPFLSR